MKKFKIVLFFLIAGITVSAQDSLRTTKKRNEIGVDLTSFLKYYINFGQETNSVLKNSPFYVQYRFHLRSTNNFRAGIGGGYNEIKTESTYTVGPANYKNKQQALNFRLGFEHYENISPKFQVFYGLDVLSGNSLQKNDAQYFNGGYANGYEIKTMSYSIAPVLGIRLKLNKRLSIFTESSFQIGINETSEKRFYIPLGNTYPPLPDSPKTITKSISTSFIFPLFIVLAIDI